MARRALGGLSFLVVLGLVPLLAQERPQPLPPGAGVEVGQGTIERLAGLGRLWGAVKFFHPYLAYKPIDWDAALVKAVPLVKAARTSSEYADAIDVMLKALDDPGTEVYRGSHEPSTAVVPQGTAQEPTYFQVLDGYLIMNAVAWAAALAGGDPAAMSQQPQMLAAIPSAKGIVLDCRYSSVPVAMQPQYFSFASYLEASASSLMRGTIPLGTERYRMHSGYAQQQAASSGGYTSGFVTRVPGAILGRASDTKPLALLVGERTPDLLPLFSGLQAAGVKIVRVGSSSAPADVRPMLLPDGVRVKIRISEFVHPAGGSTFQPDVVLTNEAGGGEAGIRAAIAALEDKRERPPATVANAVTPPVQPQKDDPYREMSLPPEEYRMLALFRFWTAVHYFFPYKDLADKPWSSVLQEFIPRFLNATSALEYQTAIAEMVARIQDSHGATLLPALNQKLGTFAPPLRLASAGGKLVVVELLDPAVAEAAGIERGDVILGIDGQPVAERLDALARLRAMSTPQAAYVFVYPTALRGEKDSTLALRVEGPDGRRRDVQLRRSVSLGTVSGMLPRTTPIFEIMPNGYGYIDLARLPLADAQKAMDALLNTPAIVFDMRGYPKGTAWAIAPRLTDKRNITAALFRRPLQLATGFDEGDGRSSPSYTFEQKLPPPQGAIYHGKVVMLINEFAISQSEHSCLVFEAATDVTFIGSPTNGANGDVTNVVLPGNIVVNFTGQDVHHADGRQLQRVGIQPHVKVEPTAKGISEGRDEILEAAVAHLNRAMKKGTS